MIALTKAAAVVAALASKLGVELHPKVAATPVGAAVAAVLLEGLSLAHVAVPASAQDTIAVVCTILAAYVHPDHPGS